MADWSQRFASACERLAALRIQFASVTEEWRRVAAAASKGADA